MRRYPKEVHEFIAKHVKGRTTAELTAHVNEKFGPIFTEGKMKSYKSNHKLKSGTPVGMPAGGPTKLYPKQVRDFIHKNHKGTGPKDMAELLNEAFGTEYTKEQMKSFYGNNNISSGLTGRFQKGNIPPNKGRTGYVAPGSEKGWFKKGQASHNKMPVGTEVIKGDGYLWKKVAEPNKWRQKHILVWEEKNGEVPDGHVLTFLDGDRTNVDIDNIALITMAESLQLTRMKLRSENPEFTKTGILIAKITTTGHALSKKKKGDHHGQEAELQND